MYYVFIQVGFMSAQNMRSLRQKHLTPPNSKPNGNSNHISNHNPNLLLVQAQPIKALRPVTTNVTLIVNC